MIFVGNLGTTNKLASILPNQNQAKNIDVVYAAIAYGSEQHTPNFIDNCKNNKFDVNLWMRFDHMIPVSSGLMKKIKKIKNIKCQFIHDDLHAKLIWWKGYGAYVGSANLTDKAWNKGIEIGLFLNNEEIVKNNLDIQLSNFFRDIGEIEGNFLLNDGFIDKVSEMEVFNKKWQNKAKELRIKSGLYKPKKIINDDSSEFIAYVGKDHLEKGHFNVKKSYSDFFAEHDSTIVIHSDDSTYEGKIKSQPNGSPRIFGYKKLKNWYIQNNALDKHIIVKIINSNEIKISIANKK